MQHVVLEIELPDDPTRLRLLYHAILRLHHVYPVYATELDRIAEKRKLLEPRKPDA